MRRPVELLGGGLPPEGLYKSCNCRAPKWAREGLTTPGLSPWTLLVSGSSEPRQETVSICTQADQTWTLPRQPQKSPLTVDGERHYSHTTKANSVETGSVSCTIHSLPAVRITTVAGCFGHDYPSDQHWWD